MTIEALLENPSIDGRVGGLLGQGWRHYYRFLHPAGRLEQGKLRRLAWSELAAARGVPLDVGSNAWHEVSGFRLHHPGRGALFDAEPEVGPVRGVLVPVLRGLDEAKAQVRFAEWVGYDQELIGRRLPGTELVGVVGRAGLGYSIWSSPLDVLLDLIENAEHQENWPAAAVWANYVWDVDRKWAVVADGDLASTYVGSQFPIVWPSTLEGDEVAPTASIS